MYVKQAWVLFENIWKIIILIIYYISFGLMLFWNNFILIYLNKKSSFLKLFNYLATK